MPGWSKVTTQITDTSTGETISCPKDGNTSITAQIALGQSTVTCPAGHNVPLPGGATAQDVLQAAYDAERG